MKRKYEKPELQRFGNFRDLTKDWCSEHLGHPRWIAEGCRTS